MKFDSIKVPILNDEYYVVVCWGDQGTAKKYITKHTSGAAEFCELDDDRGTCWFNEDFTYMPIIYINLKDRRFYGTLAHEACHAINAMWKRLGEASRDEIFAYSVGAIVGAVEKRVKRCG